MYDLIDIPDDQLTPDQISIKKRQRMLKNAREGRMKAQAIQREKQQKVWIIHTNLYTLHKLYFTRVILSIAVRAFAIWLGGCWFEPYLCLSCAKLRTWKIGSDCSYVKWSEFRVKVLGLSNETIKLCPHVTEGICHNEDPLLLWPWVSCIGFNLWCLSICKKFLKECKTTNRDHAK